MVDEKITLHVGPNRKPGTRWITYIVPAGGGIAMSATVGSLVEAVQRAVDRGYDLDVDPDAYAAMVDAGAAPPDPPADYRDLLTSE